MSAEIAEILFIISSECIVSVADKFQDKFHFPISTFQETFSQNNEFSYQAFIFAKKS
jgi:hypothetical protein